MKNHVDADSIKIGVVGAGSWGTALANLLGSKGFKIDLWAFEKDVRDQIQTHRENSVFLPGFSLSTHIVAFNDITRVVSGKDLILIVVPSHVMREVARGLAGNVSKEVIIVSASKGIENKTHLTMSGVLKEVLADVPEGQFAVLSGPSFAREVASNVPTVVTVASQDPKVATFVQHIFAKPFFQSLYK